MSFSKQTKNDYIKQFLDLPKFFAAISGVRNGEVHRMCSEVVKVYSVGFEYHTFPDDHGVTIVTGVSDIKTSRYFEDTYEWFDKNRSEVLHL